MPFPYGSGRAIVRHCLHNDDIALKEAANGLTASEAGLIVAGEPTLAKGFDKAVTKADKVVKRSLDATTDERDRLGASGSRQDLA